MIRFLGLLAGAVFAIVACGGAPSTAASPTPSAPPKLSVALPAAVKDKGKLAAGIKCDYPPFGYTDETGSTVGYEIDMVRRMAWYAFGDSNAVNLQCVVAANRISFLTTNKIDLVVATMTYTPERAKTVAFSDPYFSAAGRLLVGKDATIKEAKDMAGKSVATIKGSVYATYFQNCVPQATVLTFDGTADALSALNQGRAQAFVQDDTLLVDLAKKNANLKMVGSGVAAGPWGIGIRLEDTALAAWVNAALAQMQKEDFNWKNFQKWIPDKTTQQLFGNVVPRPNQTLRYGQGPVATQCTT
ncbi:MAG TPA: transporter substrate-binding domain-containing protein [Candidatus Dormibacteraeota bacterium]|nr:transporter substrate-binding domain-containing protein [Candidatus Dormibacteraeota bacterium]